MKRLILHITFAIFFTSLICGTLSVYGEGMYQDDLTGLKAPEISGGLWLNSTPIKLANLKGKIVLIDFWDYTCVNCQRTLPYLKEWYNRYNQCGFTIIGVHAPEFGFAKDSENVKRALDEFGIKYPVVLDNDYEIWKAYRNHFWPRKILIDEDGVVKLDHAGEGRYVATEVKIRELLKNQQPDIKFPELMEPLKATDIDGSLCYPTTPELYAGFLRGILGNEEGYHKDTAFNYKDMGKYVDGKIYLNGNWVATPESLRHIGATPALSDYIAIKYHAIEVNAVIKTRNSAPVKVFITQDGKPLNEENKGSDVVIDAESQSYVLVTFPGMYNLIKTKVFGSHELRLYTNSDGSGRLCLHLWLLPCSQVQPYAFVDVSEIKSLKYYPNLII